MADPKNIRSIALVAHAGTGKTSFSEALLYKAGATTRLGKIEEGNTLSDHDPEETKRQVSMTTGVLHCDWRGHRIYVLDTPGYADFVGEVVGALRAVDAGVVLVDGSATSLEVGTIRVWKLLDAEALPRMVFVTKLDRENADYARTVGEVRERLGSMCVPVAYPKGQHQAMSGVVSLLEPEQLGELDEGDRAAADQLRQTLIEAVAETDDALLERYLDSGELSDDEVRQGLHSATAAGTIVPILCGAPTAMHGIAEALDAVVKYLPSPMERAPLSGTSTSTHESVVVAPGDGNFAAQVYKTISDPFVGQLTLFRVFAGTLKSDGSMLNVSRGAKERAGQLYILQGKEQTPVTDVGPGDLAAVAKLKEIGNGDSLGAEGSETVLRPIRFPEPSISYSIKPKSRADEGKISAALAKLTDEDPTFRVSREQQTKELIISGVGDMHLEVMVSRLKDRFGVEVEVGTPKVAYKETVTKTVQVQGKHKKQSGGRGQFGDVWLEISPLPRGEEFLFENRIVGGVVPRQYIPAVEKGVRSAMADGIVAGYPVTDLKVALYDGSFHTVDSSDIAFQIAGGLAIRKGVMDAGPVLLEPIMIIEATVPEEFMGAVNGDLNSRRGRIMGMDAAGDQQTVKAQVPLSEVLKYATDLRSMTQGRGSYTMHFSHYDVAPQQVAARVIAESKQTEIAEEKHA